LLVAQEQQDRVMLVAQVQQIQAVHQHQAVVVAQEQ
jgi:hypothetical protein